MRRMIDEIDFENLIFNKRKNCLLGQDVDKRYFIKIEIKSPPNKRNSLKKEYEIIKHLNNSKCQTAPVVYEFGTIDKNYLVDKISNDNNLLSKGEYSYIIQDYLVDSGNYTLADVMFTIVEQKNLEVYQGDIKPDNIRYDNEKDICYFIDYDQAVFLTKDLSNLRTDDFIRFCDKFDLTTYKIGDWLRHFNNFNRSDLNKIISLGKLDLSFVKLFNKQNTTNTTNGFYHTIDKRDVFLHANRDIRTRSKIIDNIEFFEGERVLDVGCNTGLLSEYLYERGCKVTGFDIDQRIVTACKMVSNICGKDIDYFVGNLDELDELGEFDTVFLFSVFHHTTNYKENAKKIIDSCNRIIIEARPHERGSQPNEMGVWSVVSGWDFSNVQQLIDYLQDIFVGFSLKKNHGPCDKNRFVLEFTRQEGL